MDKKLFISKAPLRLGLAGGGSDVSPFSDEYGGLVLNATINLYCYAILEPRFDDVINISADDLNTNISCKTNEKIPYEENLKLHFGVINKIKKEFNIKRNLSFNLNTYSDAPAGSGLGTSSTMVVCLVQVFSEWLGLGLGEYEMANLAYEIERIDLNLKGGKQDHYSSSFGGFNFIEFGPSNKVIVNPLRVKKHFIKLLELSTILFFTGQSRSSSKIINAQIENTNSERRSTIDSIKTLKQGAIDMKEAILTGKIESYEIILRESWIAKKEISNLISNSLIESFYEVAINAGALAGKISGAGGGGFLILYVKPRDKINVINELNNKIKTLGKDFNGYVKYFEFTYNGCECWSY